MVDVKDDGAKMATPQADLGRQIMDPCVPKNEREWWAAKRINGLIDTVATLQRQLAERDAALRKIASQKLTSELHPDLQEGDFESGYEECVRIARGAIASDKESK